MGALAQAVKSGKALYAGISNYNAQQTEEALRALKDLGLKLLIHQPRYNMLDRRPEEGLYDVLQREGVGAIPFSPLEQGILTDRYLQGIPADSRAAGASIFLTPEKLTDEVMAKVRALNDLAKDRGQTLAQMAVSWLLKTPVTASVIIGASRLSQIQDAARAQDQVVFTQEELNRIDQITKG